ncbi:MAG: gliding motility-associated C-terminal domain-containing protein [Flavobacteriales bacterium]
MTRPFRQTLLRIHLAALGVLMFVGLASAQQYSITAGTIDACVGVLEDSGGPAASYSNGENFTVVICPTTPGDAISLFWAVYNLSTANPNPHDQIQIWDGDNTSATYLGNYQGTSLQGLVVSATTFNTTGCLTVQFTSNANGVGDFAAAISCFTPCERPTAVANMSEAVPALVCVGEPVSFDGSASYAAPTFTITEYTWVFDDGTTASGPTASHSFSVPGEYVVQLNLLDNNDCVNSNVVDLQVLVSTTPIFGVSFVSAETCLGATVNLDATTVAATTWTGIPEANFGDGVYLPDDVGTPFSSDLLFQQFDPGQVTTGVGDILSICVSMEHSFMGDLVLSVTCPNGQSIILHQQNGGGTFIGDANDGDGNVNPVPGTCWDYCWSPTATLGTWAESSQFGVTPNVMPSSQGTALVPGTYTPIQPFTNLIGCPLNGTWTFTSLDLWGADNGFLCNWSINFNPAIIPDVTQFTPDLGVDTPDSAYWSGPFLTLDPLSPLTATATPTGAGAFDYTFFVVDNFGCSYDTTVTVTIAPQTEIDAGADIVLCNDPEPMAGVVTANGPPASCLWTLELNEAFGDGWNGGATLAVTIGGVTTNYAVPSGPTQQIIQLTVNTGDPISLDYTAGSIWNGENSFILYDDMGATVYSSPFGPPTGNSWQGVISCGGGVSPIAWEWTPTTGLDDPTDPLTNVFVTQATMFYLTAYPVGSPECAVMDSVLVSPDPSIDAGLNNALTVCASELAFQMTDSLGGTPDAGGVWTASGGAVVPDTFDPNTGATDTYTYTVSSLAGCQATSELDITVIPADDPSCCGVPDAGLPTYSCDLTIALGATPGNTGVGVWQGPAGAVFGNAGDAITTVTMPPGSGGSHMFYWVENDGAFCNTIDSVLMTFTDTILIAFTPTDAVCYSYCDGTAQASVTGGNAAVGFTYDWSGAVVGAGDHVSGLCAGVYGLTVTDDNGCIGSNEVTITEPILLEIDSLATHPVTCSGDCDGQVEVYDPEALQYSFDDGATWAPDAILPNACEGIYPIRIRNLADCIGTGAIAVTGPPPVVAEFEWSPIPANVNDPTVHFHNLSTGAQSYYWDIAGLTTSTETNLAYRFSEKEPGTYNVCMVAYNYNECTDTICYDVIIDDVLFTYIPNSFTPDGDGLNDTFWMSSNIPVMSKFEFMVFDRWGGLVYETDNPYAPWLGSFQNSGDILSTGVYAYRVMYEIQATEVRKELMGHVTLIK